MHSDPSRPPSSGAAHDNNNNSTTSHLTQSFRDQKQIESFIRSNKLLKIIEGVSEQYVKTFQQTRRPDDALAAIIVVVPFVYADFLHAGSYDLLHLIIEEPLQFEGSVKYCVFNLVRECVKAIPDSGIKTVDIAQVHVQLRFLGLPIQQSLIFDPAQNLYPTGLAVILGILSAFTETEKLVLQSVWFCSAGCSRNKIKAESVEAPLCSSCSRPMSEYSKLRSTQNFCLLRVLPVACIQTPRVINKIFRSTTVRVRGLILNNFCFLWLMS